MHKPPNRFYPFMYQPEELFVCENPAWFIEGTGSPVSCLDFSSDGSVVAFSNIPGQICLSSCFTSDIKRKSLTQYTSQSLTGCRFHPSQESLLLLTSRDGHIMLHDLEKDEVVALSRHLGSNLLTMNVDSFGEIFAIGCADGSIRIYNLENFQRTKALVKMTSRSSIPQQISIYSLVFHPEDSNILLAAGWNDRVLFWDLRTGNAERVIAGPHIRGPGLDIYNDMIITASARDKKQIEVWDYGTTKKIKDIPFDTDDMKKECFANAVKVSRNGLDMVAGGSGSNLAQAFEYTSGTCIGQTDAFNSPVCILSSSPFGSGFVVGTEQGDLASYMIRVKSN